VFLIAGSGRSGTSAVAKLLHASGLAAGHDLIEADESNADGYFEERAVIQMNDRLLAESGLQGRFAYAERAQVLAAAAPYEVEMRALVAQATPAWKDPRFSWTLEAWLPLFDEPPRIIVCLRSPAEVIASTMRYYGLVDDEGARAVEHNWRCQYERLLEVIDDYRLDATCLEYARLHGDATSAARDLSRFVGRQLDPSMVRGELRHHEAPVPRHLVALYERVRGLGEASVVAGGRDQAGGGEAPSGV
jgi:hypothetical protein